MVKVDPTIQTLTVAGIIAIAISALLNMTVSSHSGDNATAQQAAVTANAPAADTPRGQWAASATGRVEPKDGEVRIVAPAASEIMEVTVKANDKVEAGDLLVRLDDEDIWAKLRAAEAEEAVRVRERDEEPAAKGLAEDRRTAEDALAVADRDVFHARLDLDDEAAARRAGRGSDNDVASARTKVAEAKTKADAARVALAQLNGKSDMPLPTRLESSLTIARSDVSQAETAIERMRIRAPFGGTVLNVWAKIGETAMPSPESALVLFGDVSSLRVRTEVEERDVGKVRVGQKVIVRADAFPGRDFEGAVTSLAPALGPPRILSRGPRRPNDIEVLEVMVSLDGQPDLLTGMRVDVFFRNDATGSITPAKTN